MGLDFIMKVSVSK